MKALRSLVMAFSMFSRIPMPRIDWRPESMRYMFVAFPLVGLVIGLALWGWAWIAQTVPLGNVLLAAGCTALPVLITGGIHLDGFCDTVDALSSYGDREKKLGILKDPHIGAFAMIYTVVYLLACVGCYSELAMTPALLLCLGAGMALSRTVAGWAVVFWPNAKPDGLSRTFSDSAQKRPVGIWLAVIAALLLAAAAYVQWRYAIALAVAGLLVPRWVRRVAIKQFGGMTGDIAGFTIQLTELAMLIGLIAAQKLGGFS